MIIFVDIYLSFSIIIYLTTYVSTYLPFYLSTHMFDVCCLSIPATVRKILTTTAKSNPSWTQATRHSPCFALKPTKCGNSKKQLRGCSAKTDSCKPNFQKNRDMLNTSDLAQILPAFLGIYGVKHGETHKKNNPSTHELIDPSDVFDCLLIELQPNDGVVSLHQTLGPRQNPWKSPKLLSFWERDRKG